MPCTYIVVLFSLTLVLIGVTGTACALPETRIVWHWEDTFSAAEKTKLQNWLLETTEAVEQTLGSYPFRVHYYLHRMEGRGEPVPWARTTRFDEQGVHFHVDPSYSLETFLADWTAPHEISHLSIPYLGRSESWFAEGYATYLQCQVMLTMGYYDAESLDAHYRKKLDEMRSAYRSAEPFVEVARDLGKSYRFPEMYWGSMYFFYTLDQELKAKGTALTNLIGKYLDCCRMRDEDADLDQVIRSWDKLIGSSLASKHLQAYRTQPAREILIP